MTNRRSICFIIPYFGALPWYFNFFIRSCESNPTVNFFIISDKILSDKSFPHNVRVINKSFAEMQKVISKKLGIRVEINKPHKICDFRPAYGIIFDHLLYDYDFWGHCDIDLIFGNIRGFITDKILDSHDVISVRSEYITGPFALYRNRHDVNFLFTKSKSYPQVFETNKYWGFDECGGLCFDLIDGASLNELPCEIESMTHVVKRGGNFHIRPHFDHFIIEGIPGNLIWDNGKLIYLNKFEILLYHLILYKSTQRCEIPDWEIIPNLFYINQYNFSFFKNHGV